MPLDQRRLEPEWMDSPDLAPDLHDAALRGLARLNRLAGADRGFRRPLRTLLAACPPGPVRILDLATGSADLPVALERWLEPRLPSDRSRQWIGIDISDHALARAAERTTSARIRFEGIRRNVLTEPLPTCDVAMCSLFLHHLSHIDAVTCLRRLQASARIGVIIGDLRRTSLGLMLAGLAARLVTRSPVVHADAPASVRAAFDDAEFDRVVSDAGIRLAESIRVFPQRRVAWWWSGDAEGSEGTAP